MKKTSKLLSALLALLMVVSLFAACGKDDSKKDEDKVKDNDAVQADGDETEESTDVESTTENVTGLDFVTEEDKTTEITNTTKVPGTTKAPTTKAPDSTKTPATKAPATKAPDSTKTPATKAPVTKVPDSTKAPSTKAPVTEEKNTSSNPTTKPDVTEKEENKPANVDLLAGTWETTIESDGLPVTLQFVFDKNGTLQVDFTRASYNKMIKTAVDEELSQITDEELAQAGFSSKEEAEEYLYKLLEEEASYDDLRALLKSTGKWTLNGDTLTITIGGESVTAQTKLSQGQTSFVLQDTTGELMTLTKV